MSLARRIEDIVNELPELWETKLSSVLRKRNIQSISRDYVASRLLDYFTYNKVLGISVGMQGSGKTTFIKSYFPSLTCISPDDLAYEYRESRTEKDKRSALEYMEFSGKIYPDWREIGMDGWLDRKIREIVENQMKKGKSIIIDGINPSLEHRSFYLQYADRYHYSTICFLFTTPFDVCIERIKKRAEDERKSVNVLDIYTFLQEFQSPISEEGFTENGIDLTLFMDGNFSFIRAHKKSEFYEILGLCFIPK